MLVYNKGLFITISLISEIFGQQQCYVTRLNFSNPAIKNEKLVRLSLVMGSYLPLPITDETTAEDWVSRG